MKKLLCIILSLVAACVAMIACGDKPSEEPDNALLLGFETTDEFAAVRLMNSFGNISHSTDAQYVKSGSGSAKLQPLGGYSLKTVPMFYIPLQSARFEYNYTDFSKTASISAHVYNAQNEPVKMRMGLVNKIFSHSNLETTNEIEYILESGSNDIDYMVDLPLLNISNDITKMMGIYFSFENAGSRDLKDAPVLCLDDVMLHFDQSIESHSDLIELSEDEICDFEKVYQQYVLSTVIENPKCIPELSVVKAADHGIEATSGANVLRFVTKPGDTFQATWPRFAISDKVVRESSLRTIQPKDYENTYICFDVYAQTANNVYLYPEVYNNGTDQHHVYNILTQKGKWVKSEIALSTIVANGIDPANPGFIKIAWAEYPESMYGELVYYLDNFRIERK